MKVRKIHKNRKIMSGYVSVDYSMRRYEIVLTKAMAIAQEIRGQQEARIAKVKELGKDAVQVASGIVGTRCPS